MTPSVSRSGGSLSELALCAKRAAAELHGAFTRPAQKAKSVMQRELALEGLRLAGLSIPQWADANGFSVQIVKGVLYGHLAGRRGEAHRVAVALGIKPGTIVNAAGFKPAVQVQQAPTGTTTAPKRKQRRLPRQHLPVQQAIQALQERGITVSEWARQNGFAPSDVFALLYGRTSGMSGRAHEIAVRLGLKPGARS